MHDTIDIQSYEAGSVADQGMKSILIVGRTAISKVDRKLNVMPETRTISSLLSRECNSVRGHV